MAILLRARASLPVLLLVAAIGSILQNRMYAPPQEEDQRRKAPIRQKFGRCLTHPA